MNTPLVSIIMPVYNGEKYISEAIDSVLAQSYQNIELIIINDGSTDNSKTIISHYLNNPRIHYLEQTNAGVAEARNTAIKMSKGVLIGFLDQDDLWHIDKLMDQVTYLNNHQDISLIYSNFEILNEIDGSKQPITNLVKYDITANDFKSLFMQNRIGILTTLVYKKCILKCGGLNKNIKGTDDYNLWLKIALYYKIGYMPKILASYRWHENNTSKNEIKMFIYEAICLENIIANESLATKILDTTTIEDRFFALYQKTGDLSVSLKQDRHQSRTFYEKSLKIHPLSINLIKKIILTYIPYNIISYIQWKYKIIYTKLRKKSS